MAVPRIPMEEALRRKNKQAMSNTEPKKEEVTVWAVMADRYILGVGLSPGSAFRDAGTKHFEDKDHIRLTKLDVVIPGKDVTS